ncbi:uncharacterized protein DNG_07265 [Cephalotrichum gorgonifer]|uniref:Copper acquisition factor BIM1-like domain-containing protein n=1 Tax=Cephalotrichum gorgonifer TaxID=2041049 RepID=A0AAE8N1B1_9PEZI|nr:uncharacterized protein DNG_07265 [Cephalotrichum gorgonifer]
MTRLSSSLLPLLAATATAHFSIDYPPQNVPSSESSLDQGPCGGADLESASAKVTDFHVGGDAVAVTGSHPQAKWLIRATTDLTGAGNWTQAFPIVAQSGLGKLCEPAVVVPEGWAGKKGLIGVAANAEDGILYGCSIVNFVEGSSSEAPSECRNTTQQISFDSDTQLQALVGEGSGGSSGGNSSGSDSSNGGGDQSTDGKDDDGAGASVRAGLLGAGIAAFAAALMIGLIE